MTKLRIKNTQEFTSTYSAINSLLKISPRGGGRNHQGKIIFRRSAGGAKRFLRGVDFRKIVWGLPFYILRKERDPFRTGFVYLICFMNGLMSYILATEGVEEGKCFMTTNQYGYLFTGNTLTLHQIPEGTFINSLEKKYLFGGTIARAAGTAAILLKKFATDRILIRLPSKEELVLNNMTIATVGRVSNVDHKFVKFRGAGQMRRLGIKPIVRGVARNPVDHPHGGAGGRPQVTYWSKTAKNKNTREFKSFAHSSIYLSRKKLKKRWKK